MEERREGSLEEGEARLSWAELGERVQETTLASRCACVKPQNPACGEPEDLALRDRVSGQWGEGAGGGVLAPSLCCSPALKFYTI